jgi:hypothetical protein
VLRLLKLFVFVGALAGFVWWGLTVPLGERTLFGHLRAIGDSKESQELVRGTRQKVDDLKKRIGQEETRARDGAGSSAKAPVVARAPAEDRASEAHAEDTPRRAGPPQEKLTTGDRTQMRRLLQARAKTPK